MSHRLSRWLVLPIVLALLGGLLPSAHAQEEGQRFEDAALGIAFDLPAGWEVEVRDDELIAATRPDLDAVLTGEQPQGLVLRVVSGTFNQLGVNDAAQLPDLVARLAVGAEAPPSPEPVQLASGTGYQVQYALPNDGLTTRVALLAVAGGRVAIVRGLAPTAAWEGGAGSTFDTLLSSMAFFAPERGEAALQAVNADDGGMLWQYQPTPEEAGNLRAGGITYDTFGVVYMAAGPAGVLALRMDGGTPISVMGPWIDADYTDVSIAPDTRLVLANAAAETTQALVVVDRAGNYGHGWGVRGDGDGQFAPGMPRTVAVTRAGDVWTVSEGHASGVPNRLYKFDLFGNLLLSVDLATIDPALSGVRIDANPNTGALYLVGASGRLTVLDTNGQPLARDLAEGVLQGVTVADLAVAPSGNLLVALAAPGLDGRGFVELNTAGHLLDLFGVPYDAARGGPFGPGEYLHPAGLAVTGEGMPLWSETHPETGYTQVQAFTFVGDGRVSVGAAPSGADPAAEANTPAGGPIAPGAPVRGTLNNNTPVHEWTFEGQAGQRISITMIDASGEGQLDPVINLIDPHGRAIASNDDAGANIVNGMSPRDAHLEFALPTTGTYTIEATRFGGRGEYELTLRALE